eukprot:4222214-Pleurochrysis_carterae.AAC.2
MPQIVRNQDRNGRQVDSLERSDVMQRGTGAVGVESGLLSRTHGSKQEDTHENVSRCARSQMPKCTGMQAQRQTAGQKAGMQTHE